MTRYIHKEFFDSGKMFDGINIKFLHVASGQTVQFLPYVTTFEDNYEQIWQPTEVFGRMDAIKNFKRTKRSITLAWDVPSANYREGIENFEKCQKLLQMNYPVYQKTRAVVNIDPNIFENQLAADLKTAVEDGEGANNFQNQTQKENAANLVQKLNNVSELFEPNNNLKEASIMTSPPIIGLKYGNFINDPNADFENYLYGTIQGASFKPDLEMGVWVTDGDSNPNIVAASGTQQQAFGMIPKVFSFNINFEVIHTSPIGYDFNNRTETNENLPRSNFPYGYGNKKQED